MGMRHIVLSCCVASDDIVENEFGGLARHVQRSFAGGALVLAMLDHVRLFWRQSRVGKSLDSLDRIEARQK